MSTIAGRYFVDKNVNSLEGSGDIGVSNTTVQLFQGSKLVATTRTDGNGYYKFSGVEQGYHYVKFAQSGYGSKFSKTGVGRNDGIDSDVWKTDGSGAGVSGSFYVGRSAFVNNVDAGVIPSSSTATYSNSGNSGSSGNGSIKGRYFFDKNNSDKEDGGDTGVSSSTVSLMKGDSVVATTKTDGNGNYEFKNIADGGYTIQFAGLNGHKFARPGVGSSESYDSDVWKTNGDGSGPSSYIVIRGGNTVSNVDAGAQATSSVASPKPTPVSDSGNGALQGRYFFDKNNSNQEDGGDTGMSNATVRLIQSGEVVATTKTDGNGNYKFSNLSDGWYGVEFDSVSSSYKFARSNSGNNDYVDSDVWRTSNNDGQTASFQVRNGNTVSNVDGGVQLKATPTSTPEPTPAQKTAAGSLEGRYFQDKNNSNTENGGDTGVSNATVRLVQSGEVVATTKTDGNGKYKFSGLEDGWYGVEFASVSSAYKFASTNSGGNDSIDSDVWKTSGGWGSTGHYEVKNGSKVYHVDAGIQAANSAPPTPVPVVENEGSIAGRYFFDRDKDAVEDGGDTGVSGATVRLTESGKVVATTKTDGNGNYKFSGLDDGGYKVEFKLLSSAYEFTRANSGGNDSIDSDVWTTNNGWGEASYHNVSGGKDFTNTDAGIVQKSAAPAPTPTPTPTPTPAPTPTPTPTPVPSVDDDLSILFVGNSYTYYAPNGNKSQSPEGHFVSLLKAAGYDVSYDSAFVGGASLKKLWDTTNAQSMIKSGDYDMVILQGYNKNMDSSSGLAEFRNYADKFTDLADANGADSAFYGIWAGDWQISASGDTWGAGAHNIYKGAASANGSAYAPNGMAMAKAHEILTDRYGDNGQKAEELLTVDAIHAHSTGAYLAANVLFETLMPGDAPSNSSYNPGGVSNSDANLMQQIADDIVSQYAITASSDWFA